MAKEVTDYDYYFNNMNEKDYNNMVNKSTNGKKQSSKANKYMKVHKQRFKAACITVCCACCIFGAVAFNSGKSMIDRMSTNWNTMVEMHDLENDFNRDYVRDNTHPAKAGGKYWYDTHAISEGVKTDRDIYLLWQNVGEKSADDVLSWKTTEYTSIRDYLDKHGYKDGDEWSKAEYSKLAQERKMAEKEKELKEMQMDYDSQFKEPVQVAEADMGGK